MRPSLWSPWTRRSLPRSRSFSRDIREYVHKLFFVLNKIDYVDEARRQEALEFTTQVLQANLATEQVMIFPLSAKTGAGRQGPTDIPNFWQPVCSLSLKIICVSFSIRKKGGCC